MKRKAAAFAVILLLAVCFAVAAPIYLDATADDFTLDGEVLYGDVAEADNVRIKQDINVSGHLIWHADRIPGVSAATDSYWSLLGEEREYTPYESRPALWLNSFSMGASWSGEMDTSGIEGEIIDDVIEKAGGGSYYGSVLLNDYTDCYPIQFDSYGMNVEMPDGTVLGDYPFEDSDVSDFFRVPLDRNIKITVSCIIEESGRREITLNSVGMDDIGLWSHSAQFDGFIYLAALMYDGATDTFMDPSQLPGGSWGVWRIPFDNGETTGEPTLKLAGAELVYSFDESVKSFNIASSADGSEALLVTFEGDKVMLNVMDGETGALRLRTEVLNDESAAAAGVASASERSSFGIYANDDFTVLSGWDTIILLTGDDYTPRAVINTETLPITGGKPASEDEYVSPSEEAYLFDGEKLYLLEHGRYNNQMSSDTMPNPYYDFSGFARLSVFSVDGELLYCEWILSPVDYGSYSVPRVGSDFSIELVSDE